MVEPIGPLTRAYLERLGYSARKIDGWSGQTRLLQDIGLTGDNAWDEFQILHRQFGVDLRGFSIDTYFPPELSTEAFILSFLPRSRWAAHIRRRYPEITLSMVEDVLRRKRWAVEELCSVRLTDG